MFLFSVHGYNIIVLLPVWCVSCHRRQSRITHRIGCLMHVGNNLASTSITHAYMHIRLAFYWRPSNIIIVVRLVRLFVNQMITNVALCTGRNTGTCLNGL